MRIYISKPISGHDLAIFDVNYHLKKEKPLYRATPNV